ncbi:MAG: ribonuclease P protein component [Bacteroidetes bacterium]|nr:ribonuclease P protein component [Bacteroidota bacterium]
MPGKFLYQRKDKLKSRKLIGKVFETSQSLSVFPLKVLYLQTPLPVNTTIQSGFTVGRKNFPKAIHRNRIKRLMRETYRMNNALLKEVIKKYEIQLALFFIFTGKSLPDYEQVNRAMQKIFLELKIRFDENSIENS